MDIKQLHYFIALAEELQVTSAANRLHMSQPPLSQQLKLMETELGVPLFNRSGRHLELTGPGKLLYEHALTITRLMDEAKAEVQESGLGLRGKLSIGVNTLSDVLLPRVLSAFRVLYPNVTFKIQQNETNTLTQLVRSKMLDLAIVRLPIALEDFEHIELREEPLYLVTRLEGSRTNGVENENDAVSFKTIASYPLVLPSTEGLGLYHFILEQFHKRGLSPTVVGECSDIGMLLELVESGFGASILPATSLKRNRNDQLRTFAIADAHDIPRSAVIWLKRHYLSKAAQQLIHLIRKEVNDVQS